HDGCWVTTSDERAACIPVLISLRLLADQRVTTVLPDFTCGVRFAFLNGWCTGRPLWFSLPELHGGYRCYDGPAVRSGIRWSDAQSQRLSPLDHGRHGHTNAQSGRDISQAH